MYEGVFKPDNQVQIGYAGYFEIQGGPTLMMMEHEVDNERFTRIYIAAYEAHRLQSNAGIALQAIFDTMVRQVVAEQRAFAQQEEQRLQEEQLNRERAASSEVSEAETSSLEAARMRREQENAAKVAYNNQRSSLQRASAHGKKKRAEKLHELRTKNHGSRRPASSSGDVSSGPASVETNAFVFDSSGTEFNLTKSMEASTPIDDASQQDSSLGQMSASGTQDEDMAFIDNLETSVVDDVNDIKDGMSRVLSDESY